MKFLAGFNEIRLMQNNPGVNAISVQTMKFSAVFALIIQQKSGQSGYVKPWSTLHEFLHFDCFASIYAHFINEKKRKKMHSLAPLAIELIQNGFEFFHFLGSCPWYISEYNRTHWK